MADHIPDPARHRTLFYAYYANRIRGDRDQEAPKKKLSRSGLQVPEIIIDPYPSNAIFLNSFSTVATSFHIASFSVNSSIK